MPDRAHQRLVRDVDPQVHRVQRHEARVLALLAHPALEVGLDVGQEQHVARPRRLRQLGLEVLEDVEVGLERVADVEVALVAAGPEERLAALDVLDVVDEPRRGCAGRRTRSRRSRRRPGRPGRVSAKNDDASEKWTAEPPSSRSRLPASVSTASKAMEPTTVSDMGGKRVARR